VYGDSFFVVVMRSVKWALFCVMVMQSVIPNNRLWYHCWIIYFTSYRLWL